MQTLRRALAAAGIAATVVAEPALAQPAMPEWPATAARMGLFVRLDAKPGQEAAVARFLQGGKTIVDAEPATSTWFALRLDPTTFAIFDTFPDEAGRSAHLSGKVAAALMAQAPELLVRPPVIEKVDILAVKVSTAPLGQ